MVQMKKISLALMAVCGLATTASAQIFSDNFNAETLGLSTTTLTNWTVVNEVDVLGDGFIDFYPGNGKFIDMAGSPGFGKITTKSSFNLAPGAYVLSFDLGKNGSAATSMDVSVGTAFTTTISDAIAYNAFVPQVFNFIVGAPTVVTLNFDYNGGPNNQGYIIDNVVLRNGDAPEPGTFALLGLGLAAGLVARRRRSL
jgi:hypothetical protein